MILTRTFKDRVPRIFSSLETIANFILISFIFFKFINIKEIKFEDLQQIGSFYHDLISQSFRRTFALASIAKAKLINEDQLRRAFNVARAQICQILVILHVQKDIKIVRFEQTMAAVFKELSQKYPREDLDSRCSNEEESSASQNAETPLTHFSEMFENLGKKFHHENAYHKNYVEFKMQVLSE